MATGNNKTYNIQNMSQEERDATIKALAKIINDPQYKNSKKRENALLLMRKFDEIKPAAIPAKEFKFTLNK